jgi:hypothetical protein
VHAVAQHTPSTHRLLLHSGAPPQLVPLTFRPHEVPLHTFPLAHWAPPEVQLA